MDALPLVVVGLAVASVAALGWWYRRDPKPRLGLGVHPLDPINASTALRAASTNLRSDAFETSGEGSFEGKIPGEKPRYHEYLEHYYKYRNGWNLRKDLSPEEQRLFPERSVPSAVNCCSAYALSEVRRASVVGFRVFRFYCPPDDPNVREKVIALLRSRGFSVEFTEGANPDANGRNGRPSFIDIKW